MNHHNLDAGDFLARIRANMEVRDDIPLGWRISNEAKNAIRRLQTAEDAQLAVDTILQKIDNPNRRNEVMLKIVDTREKEKVHDCESTFERLIIALGCACKTSDQSDGNGVPRGVDYRERQASMREFEPHVLLHPHHRSPCRSAHCTHHAGYHFLGPRDGAL